eukprot:COSAG01_NODE_6031_length_3889_cov_6.715567_3_plen_109_part_00
MDNATNKWDNEMNDLLAMAREQLEILHGEIFDRNLEHKVIDKCDTLIDHILLYRVPHRRCMGGQAANSVLSHSSRILWTTRVVHTTYVAQPMGRLAVRGSYAGPRWPR